MVGELSQKEKRALSRELSDYIYQWTERTFGEQKAFAITNYVRALAKNAALNRTGSNRGQLLQNRKEAHDVKEAAQDIMELIDSIRWNASHKGEAAE